MVSKDLGKDGFVVISAAPYLIHLSIAAICHGSRKLNFVCMKGVVQWLVAVWSSPWLLVLEIACMILLCKILSSTSVVYIVLAIAGNPLLNLFP